MICPKYLYFTNITSAKTLSKIKIPAAHTYISTAFSILSRILHAATPPLYTF